jgi:hypothetical protein
MSFIEESHITKNAASAYFGGSMTKVSFETLAADQHGQLPTLQEA